MPLQDTHPSRQNLTEGAGLAMYLLHVAKGTAAAVISKPADVVGGLQSHKGERMQAYMMCAARTAAQGCYPHAQSPSHSTSHKSGNMQAHVMCSAQEGG